MTDVTALYWLLLTATFVISVAALVLSLRRFSKWMLTKEIRELNTLVFGLQADNEKLMHQLKNVGQRLNMRERREQAKEQSYESTSDLPDPNLNPDEWRRAINARVNRR